MKSFRTELHIGLTRNIEPLDTPSVFIHDHVPTKPFARIFDPTKHAIDVFEKITERRAEELADTIYQSRPEGENTLTVRNGKIALKKLLAKAKRFDAITTTDEEVTRILDDLLFTPEIRNAICGTNNIFKFHKHSIIFVELNRAAIGERACKVIGRFIISLYKGQFIIDDAGFYLTDAHTYLVKEKRIIAGVATLSQLPPRLRDELLLVKDKHASGALYDDAVLLAKYQGLQPDPTREANPYNEFIQAAMN